MFDSFSAGQGPAWTCPFKVAVAFGVRSMLGYREPRIRGLQTCGSRAPSSRVHPVSMSWLPSWRKAELRSGLAHSLSLTASLKLVAMP